MENLLRIKKKEMENIYIYINEEYYNGQFLNDLKHGKGKEYYKNDNIKSNGNFIKGKYEGFGTFIYKNGEYYSGQWLNSLKHGKGKNIITLFQ